MRSIKIVIGLMIGILFFSAAPSQADSNLTSQVIIYESSGGNARVSVPTSNGNEAPSVMYRGSDGSFATGAAARNLSGDSRQEQENRILRKFLEILLEEENAKKSAPALEKEDAAWLLPIYEKGKFAGSIYELEAGSGVFVSSRHTLQSQKVENIRQAFASAGLDLSKFSTLSGKGGTGKNLDIVLFIPQGKLYDWLSPLVNNECGADPSITYQLRDLNIFQHNIVPGTPFYSKQFGLVGNKETKQLSRGNISMQSIDRLYLPANKENYTTAGSSGSVVVVYVKDKEWKIAGITECIIPSRKTRNNVEIPAAVQVLPISTLQQAVFSAEPLQGISAEQTNLDPECVPIDPRGAGGE